MKLGLGSSVQENNMLRKILSILLFIVAAWFVAAGILNAVLRSRAGLSPEWGVVCILPVLGGLLVWAGIALWRKQR
jgi:uncharacterized membrane protein HdeD (DUF308 family)